MDEERIEEQVSESPIEDLGSSIIRTDRGTVYVLTIVGQIEGHQLLPPTSKSTKYEHVLPLLAAIEGGQDIDGLLILLNNGGGDVEAGLAISEVIASMSKPRLSGAGGQSLHRSPPGGVGQKVLHRSIGRHDHPPGAAQRPGHRRAPDLLLFRAHSGADLAVCHCQQQSKA